PPAPIPGTVSVFKANPSTRPLDTSTFNESDYEIDANRAKVHQAHLQAAAQGTRLPSDKEITEKLQEKEKKAKSTIVDVRIRFPDNLFLQRTFAGTDTAADL